MRTASDSSPSTAVTVHTSYWTPFRIVHTLIASAGSQFPRIGGRKRGAAVSGNMITHSANHAVDAVQARHAIAPNHPLSEWHRSDRPTVPACRPSRFARLFFLCPRRVGDGQSGFRHQTVSLDRVRTGRNPGIRRVTRPLPAFTYPAFDRDSSRLSTSRHHDARTADRANGRRFGRPRAARLAVLLSSIQRRLSAVAVAA